MLLIYLQTMVKPMILMPFGWLKWLALPQGLGAELRGQVLQNDAVGGREEGQDVPQRTRQRAAQAPWGAPGAPNLWKGRRNGWEW